MSVFNSYSGGNSSIVGRYVGLRELGLSPRVPGMTDQLYKRLYSAFDDNLALDERHFVYTDYSGSKHKRLPVVGPTGAIFNLAFNTDGSLLGAASERKSILIFDPTSRKLVNSVENAHEDSVNCIRFLDTRLFATCSDDSMVALWDARYLKSQLRTLKGHTNWVKNIEFSYRENCLVTSGFDGSIVLWDINRYSEREGLECRKAFYSNGLMRMKLTADGTKMVITTTNAYIMIIHDLCLETLSQDLQNFKPNLYRTMQISGDPTKNAFQFTHLFHAKRNRVEFISDFAPEDDAEVISSLQLHPHGWVAVSRNISADERSEWCCVHDIQSYPTSLEDDIGFEEESTSGNGTSSSSAHPAAVFGRSGGSSNAGIARLAAFMQGNTSFAISNISLRQNANAAGPIAVAVGGEEGGGGAVPLGGGGEGEGELAGNPLRRTMSFPDTPYLDRIVQFLHSRSRDRRLPPNRADAAESDSSDDEEQLPGVLLFTTDSNPNSPLSGVMIQLGSRRRRQNLRREVPKDAKVHKNRPRMTHFIEESNHCRGYIKEISFSPDGRIFASPFANGIRLLSFDNQVRELSDDPPSFPSMSPKPLHELSLLTKIHSDAVLSTAFAPHGFSLVSGCMAGKIVWHQPMM